MRRRGEEATERLGGRGGAGGALEVAGQKGGGVTVIEKCRRSDGV